MSVLFAFLHHIAAFVLFAAIVVEFVVIRDELTLRTARRLLRTDAVVGMAAASLLLVGILRVVFFEKGGDYYLHSVPFMVKMSLFVLIALTSLYPTVKFMSWRGAIRQGQPPAVDAGTLRTIRTVLHVELAGVVVLMLMGTMMARGVGMIEALRAAALT
jgi:putative membrane protein